MVSNIYITLCTDWSIDGWLRCNVQFRHPGAHRTMVLWERMMPIYVAYVLMKRRTRRGKEDGKLTQDEVDAMWADLHEWGGDKAYQMVLEASGYIVKVAQVMFSNSTAIPKQADDQRRAFSCPFNEISLLSHLSYSVLNC